MTQTTTITISRDNTDEIELEVTGSYRPASYGGREEGMPVSPDSPECFEDIEATVVEDAHLDGDETVITYKQGEVIRLTAREEELANAALLKAWKNDI